MAAFCRGATRQHSTTAHSQHKSNSCSIQGSAAEHTTPPATGSSAQRRIAQGQAQLSQSGKNRALQLTWQQDGSRQNTSGRLQPSTLARTCNQEQSTREETCQVLRCLNLLLLAARPAHRREWRRPQSGMRFALLPGVLCLVSSVPKTLQSNGEGRAAWESRSSKMKESPARPHAGRFRAG